MKPKIDHTEFGSISVAGEIYEHDIIICLDGSVKKRKKKLSKDIFGTSHILSLDEAKFIYETGVQQLIIGNGQNGMLHLSDEAKDFFHTQGCQVNLLPTPKAIKAWNSAQGSGIALFHVTC